MQFGQHQTQLKEGENDFVLIQAVQRKLALDGVQLERTHQCPALMLRGGGDRFEAFFEVLDFRGWEGDDDATVREILIRAVQNRDKALKLNYCNRYELVVCTDKGMVDAEQVRKLKCWLAGLKVDTFLLGDFFDMKLEKIFFGISVPTAITA